MTLDPVLLDLVADPVDHEPLEWTPDGFLRNARRGVRYPVLDGVPALLGQRPEPVPGAAADPAAPAVGSFDGLADWYDAVMQSPDEHGPMTARANEMIAAELAGVSGAVLDVACGTGLSPRWLGPLGVHVVGVDISSDQLRIARGRLPVVQGDAAALPFRDGSLDAVVTAYSAAPDLAGSAREAHRVLRPGGRYVQVHVHPVLNGSWTSRVGDGGAVVGAGYHRTSQVAPDSHATTIRGRVGSVHVPFDAYLAAPLDAGFRLLRLREFGEYDDGLPTSLLTTWLKD